MDKMDNRKSSWDSKMSMSTVSHTGPRNGRSCHHHDPYRRSASSIISSDSDIRFTRKKLGSACRCGCCVTAAILICMLLAAAALYVAYTWFRPDQPDEEIFRAMFRVVDGDSWSPEMADPSTIHFRSRAVDYRRRLNMLFNRSAMADKFIDTEILALDGNEGKDLIVHFNVRMYPGFTSIETTDLVNIFHTELSQENSQIFKNLTIDSTSLDVQKNYYIATTTTTPAPSTKIVTEIVATNAPMPPRKCSEIKLKYCRGLPYNTTSFPNIFGHNSLEEVEEDIALFRDLVDAECYRMAYDFVCQILQPECVKSEDSKDDINVLPCRSYCREFLAGCGNRLNPKLKEILDCNNFEEFSSLANCKTKPDCVGEMQRKKGGFESRICDGVIDCEDASDEKSCPYCPTGYLHCGVGRYCIPQNFRCDGKNDCPDGSDERACLSLYPSLSDISKQANKMATPHIAKYNSEGFVIFNEKGQTGKLCVENVELDDLYQNTSENILRTVAQSLCNTLTYQNVLSVEIRNDPEPSNDYVRMKNPKASEIQFIRTRCASKRVLHIACGNLECGLPSAHGSSQLLNKMSNYGDFPWHAALYKQDVHVCDATVVSKNWLLTTGSCFQGQPKAEWIAKVGSVRLSSLSPWQQERRIVGLVKSPVEGSTIALIKLESPLLMSDLVRPVCFPGDGVVLTNSTICNSLGWARNREQLQRVQIKMADMQKCENISIATVNSVCTEGAFNRVDCNEEELAGSPMLCLEPDGVKWFLGGISNWRIACSKNAQRPRMYDKIASNVEWIKQTISGTN